MSTTEVNEATETVETVKPAIIKIAIAPRFLKAMALFASTDETRDVLRTVALDYTNDIPVLVSTDGHRLGVYSLEHPESFCDVSQAKGQGVTNPDGANQPNQGN